MSLRACSAGASSLVVKKPNARYSASRPSTEVTRSRWLPDGGADSAPDAILLVHLLHGVAAVIRSGAGVPTSVPNTRVRTEWRGPSPPVTKAPRVAAISSLTGCRDMLPPVGLSSSKAGVGCWIGDGVHACFAAVRWQVHPERRNPRPVCPKQ